MSAPRILVIGSANMDVVIAAPRLPQRGETLLGGELRLFAGGKGANQAVAAARAGGVVTFMGCVGRDAYGGDLRAGLAADGIDTSFLAEIDGPSGVALIVTGGGENMIVVAPGANGLLGAGQIDRTAFDAIDYLLLQLETPLAGVTRAAAFAKKVGAVVILDPAPARPLAAELLAAVDWLTPNESEACLLLNDRRSGDPVETARRLLALGPGGVVLKMGERGAVLAQPGQDPVQIAPFAVTAVDSTAAGDAFNGAFAVALGEGCPPADAVRFACAAGALAASCAGAQPSMATRVAIDAMVAR